MKRNLFLCMLGLARRLEVVTAIAVILYLFAFPTQTVQAATLVVDTTADDSLLTACTSAPNDCSLRGAILHAEGTPEMDIINLPVGRYSLSEGPLMVRSSLFIVGEGQSITFIDGGNRSQVLILTGAGSPIVNISFVTFENGRGGSGVPGGAIRVDDEAYLALYDSTVRNSGSNGPGGGIANNGTLQLTRSTVTGNKVPIEGPPLTGGVQHSGGGIMNFNDAVLRIEGSTITNNEATRGGGIRNGGGHMEIINSTISGNTAHARGGGIMNFGTAFIAFSTITDNEANTLGLPCFVDEAREELRACGGGIFNDNDSTTFGRISIGNTILAGNTDNRSSVEAGYSPDCFSPILFSFTSFRGNLVGILTPNCDMRDTIWGDQRFDMVGSSKAPLDPKLALLTNNGGPTATHALLPDSLAIDNGTGITSATFFDCPSTDQRGRMRPSGSACDVGAFELTSLAALLHKDLKVLIDLRSTVIDRQDGKKLEDAIKKLSSSLDSSFWVDENTLNEKGGDKVFNEQKDAVVKLNNLIKHNNSGISDELQGLVVRLVSVDHELAALAIDQALNLAGKTNQIAIAQNELSKGDNSVSMGQYITAIEHYRNAWRHAQLAMKK